MNSWRLAWLQLCLSAVVVAAQTARAEVIRNGGFESTYDSPNRWGGVERDGFVSGFAGTLPVLGDNGGIAERQMPVAVAVADINGDGLPDIMTSDVFGYIRAYANSGSKEQPKFTSGILTTPYLGITDGTMASPLPGIDGPESSQKRLMTERNESWFRRRLGVRLSLADIGEGKLSLVAGNYFGEIFLIPQNAANDHTRFPQPEPVDQALLPMSKGPGSRWGNVFAPLLRDWDGDSKADLLVGEGSYSANNVHFFPNKASTAAPSFALADRSVLASGTGREQLTPCMVDINGDGKEDLLVSDSRGKATAYLRPANWEKGDDPIQPSGYLSTAGGLTNDENQALV
ncbi:MAG: FG-GAP repeat domain-containing protein, partial [Chthoniobacterales bacterium]